MHLIKADCRGDDLIALDSSVHLKVSVLKTMLKVSLPHGNTPRHSHWPMHESMLFPRQQLVKFDFDETVVP